MDIKSLLVGLFVVLLSGCYVDNTDVSVANEYCEKIVKSELKYLDYEEVRCEGQGSRVKLWKIYKEVYKHNLKNNP